MGRLFLIVISFGLALFGTGLAEAQERPNILFLLSDDQSYDTIRAFGLTEIDTPNLDRLAGAGTVFTHAYNMGSWSGAVCVPSRTMLVTGRALWTTQALHKRMDAERDAGRLWPQLLEQAGYDTYFTGKWHINTDPAQVFQQTRNVRGGMPEDTPEGYNRPIDGVPDSWDPADPAFGGFWEGGTHWTEVTADDAVSFLATAAARDRPFFMYVAFNAPHDPRQSPRAYLERYPLGRIRLPETFLPEYPYKDAIGSGPGLRDERLAPFPRTPGAVRTHRREYYAMISHLDAQIGRIVDALDRGGLRERTIVVFTSDHGLAVGQHGLLGKQNLYDHSIRVPFIVAGPGMRAGARISAPIYYQQIMPATLEWAGLARPAHVEFESVTRSLPNGREMPVTAIYSAYLDLQRAVTWEGHKLVVYPKVPTFRLYELAADPLEARDVAKEPAKASVARRLFAKLLELQAEWKDALDLRTVFPELAVK
jgi:arylsulfatase A-like enzyme